MSDRRAEIAQRWEAHRQPQQLAVVDDLGGGRFGLRGLRREEEALVTAPADVAWLLAEVERLRKEAPPLERIPRRLAERHIPRASGAPDMSSHG